MSDQKQLSNQARDNKAHKNHKTPGQKQSPASQRVENQTHLISPNLLQHALENPQAARPETVLQLQRQYGNWAVSQLLAQQGTNWANPPNGLQPASGSSPALIQTKLKANAPGGQYEQEADQIAHQVMTRPDRQPEANSRPLVNIRPQTGSIQRKVSYTFEEEGDLKAKKGQHINEYRVMKATFKKYEEAASIDDEYLLLTEVIRQCKLWLATRKAYSDSVEGRNVKNLLDLLVSEPKKAEFKDVDKEVKYLGKLKLTPKTFFALPGSVGGLKFKPGDKGVYYEELKGLSVAERSAINSYISENFKYINPAMAGNEAWFKAAGGNKLDNTDLKKAMKVNKRTGEMAIAGLNKLPNWEQNQALYRGETLPLDVAKSLKIGGQRHYPHFVSTSLERQTPDEMMGRHAKSTTPVKLLSTITTSKTAKDLSAVNSGEKEILFLPNTTFEIKEITIPPRMSDLLQQTSPEPEGDILKEFRETAPIEVKLEEAG